MRWTLALSRVAVAQLRQAGPTVGNALQAMATEPEPWADDLPVGHRPGRYDRNVAGHWITYTVEGETLRIQNIQPN